MPKVLVELDKIADYLEKEGRADLALDIDKISDSIAAKLKAKKAAEVQQLEGKRYEFPAIIMVFTGGEVSTRGPNLNYRVEVATQDGRISASLGEEAIIELSDSGFFQANRLPPLTKGGKPVDAPEAAGAAGAGGITYHVLATGAKKALFEEFLRKHNDIKWTDKDTGTPSTLAPKGGEYPYKIMVPAAKKDMFEKVIKYQGFRFAPAASGSPAARPGAPSTAPAPGAAR